MTNSTALRTPIQNPALLAINIFIPDLSGPAILKGKRRSTAVIFSKPSYARPAADAAQHEDLQWQLF
jgi:hypothetical protein